MPHHKRFKKNTKDKKSDFILTLTIVEFIKANPGTTRCGALENVAQSLVVHFGTAIDDIHALSEGVGKILGCFRLSRSGRSSGSAAHA